MSRLKVLLLVMMALVLASCGSNSAAPTTTTSSSTSATAPLFVTGSDAPLPAVVAFNISIDSITLNGTTPATLTNTPTTVDFARLVGSNTLLAFNSVPQGTYTGATITLSSPVITYINTSVNPPVSNMNGTLTNSTVTVTFPKPLTVSSSGLTGLHLHFDMRKSIQVDSNAQITGVVNPVIQMFAITPRDPDAHVDDLHGTLVSVNTSGNSFVIQHRLRQFTINVDNSTVWSNGASLSTLTVPSVIEVDGTIQADGSVLASSVEVMTIKNGMVDGVVIGVSPSTGAAQTITMVVNQATPGLTSILGGSVLTFDVSAVTNYDILHMQNWASSLLFNNTQVATGQHLAIGGTIDTTKNPPLVPARVILLPQGTDGTVVAGSVTVNTGNAGSFKLQNNGLIGYLLGAPIDVQTSTATNFYGVSGLSGLQDGQRVAAFGLVLKDSGGNTHLYAQRVVVPQ